MSNSQKNIKMITTQLSTLSEYLLSWKLSIKRLKYLLIEESHGFIEIYLLQQ